jgi:hypothetical protein
MRDSLTTVAPSGADSAARTVSRAVRRSMVVPCQAVRERDFRLVGRQVIDLSEDGVLVRLDQGGTTTPRVLTGESMILTFVAPFSRVFVDAEAFVARVIHGRRPGDRGREIGLIFEHIEPSARARLTRELAWLRPTTARRREPASRGSIRLG